MSGNSFRWFCYRFVFRDLKCFYFLLPYYFVWQWKKGEVCKEVPTVCCYTVASWWRKVDKVCEVVFLSSQVAITANNVRRLQLFEDDQPDCSLLALHPPDDPTQGLEWNILLLALIRHTSHRLTPSARPSSAGFIPAWQVVVCGWRPANIQHIQKWFDVGNCFFLIPLLDK